LSAALMLGRCRRRVLVCDLNRPRNRRARALHGYLTRDGIGPAELNALGREELLAYSVEVREAGVTDASWDGQIFHVTVGDGQEHARFLLLATGVIDDLPAIPGLDACYGRSVFHCPYCDGWEWRDRRLAVLGHRQTAMGTALALKTWSADVVLCTNGARGAAAGRARLGRNQIAVRAAPIARLDHSDGRLDAIAFADGELLARDALFFCTGQHPQSHLATRLGCTLTRAGTVDTGNGCETNVPNVFVAGDASRDAQFVAVATAEGVKAAVAINKSLQQMELVP
jgi:thioredoxin reductase